MGAMHIALHSRGAALVASAFLLLPMACVSPGSQDNSHGTSGEAPTPVTPHPIRTVSGIPRGTHALTTNAGATPYGAEAPIPEDRLLDIGEAVLRYEMARDGLGYAEYYLGLFGTDPGEPFLDRFKDIPRTVSAGSLFEEPGDRTYLSIDSIRRIGDTRFEVKGHRSTDPQSGTTRTYTVWLVNGEWVVVGDHLDTIS